MRFASLLQSTALCLTLGLGLTTAASATDPATAIAEVGKHVMSLGPNGEKPEPASSVSLSDASCSIPASASASLSSSTMPKWP